VPRGIDDNTVLSIAKAKNAILITRDSDFADEIRYPPGKHSEIIVLRIHPPRPDVLAKVLLKTIGLLEDLSRKTIIVYSNRIEIIEPD